MDPFRKMKLAVRNVMPGLNLFEAPVPDASEGERLLALGNFAEAEQFFLRLLDQIGDRSGRRMTHARVTFALASARYHQKKLLAAREAASATIDHLDPEKPGTELAQAEDLLATILIDLENTEEAIPHLERSLDAQLKIKPVDNGAIIQRHRRLAGILEKCGHEEKAFEHFLQASELALRECGPEHQLTGDCEAELGRYLANEGRHRDSIAHFEAALKAHLVSPGQESEEVAKDYQALATAYQAIDDLENSVLYYEKALWLRERQLGGSSADYAALLMGFAGAQSLRGRYGSAIELMQQAVGKYEGARDERLGPALESLGTVYLLSGRTEDAVTSLKRARRIWETQPEQHRERIEANTQLFETVATYLNPREADSLLASIREPGDPVRYEMRQEGRGPVAADGRGPQPQGQHTLGGMQPVGPAGPPPWMQPPSPASAPTLHPQAGAPGVAPPVAAGVPGMGPGYAGGVPPGPGPTLAPPVALQGPGVVAPGALSGPAPAADGPYFEPPALAALPRSTSGLAPLDSDPASTFFDLPYTSGGSLSAVDLSALAAGTGDGAGYSPSLSGAPGTAGAGDSDRQRTFQPIVEAPPVQPADPGRLLQLTGWEELVFDYLAVS